MKIEEIKKLQEKLYEESSELADKMSKLDIALHSYNSTEKFSINQLNLLEAQLMSMKTYYSVLRTRMEDLNNEIIRLENR